jgi:hypothetical protein
MATANKFNQFVEDLGKGVHVFGTHQLRVALTNTIPVAANSVLADLTAVIPATNLSGGTPFNVTTTSYVDTAGTAALVLVDLTLTATSSVGPFRYVVLLNDTPTSPADPLILWYDYGSSVTMAAAETFVIDFAATTLTIV